FLPETLCRRVREIRRDRWLVSRPNVWQPEPPPDRGAGRGAQVLLDPGKGEATGPGEIRGPEGHRWPRDREAAPQDQKTGAWVLHRRELQGIQGEVGGARQTGRHLEEGPRSGPHRAVHHRPHLQLRLLLLADRGPRGETRIARHRLAVRDFAWRARAVAGRPT